MKKLIILFCLFSCIILFYHCHKDSDNQAGKNLGTISFSSQDRMIVPYNGGETLTFKDSLGKYFHLHVFSPRVIDYMQVFSDPNKSTGDYYEVEQDPIVADSAFTIFIAQSSPFIQPTVKYFWIYNFQIASHPEIKGYFGGEWGFNEGQLFSVQNNYNPISTLNFYDSLTIINKKYNSVYDLSFIGVPSKDSAEVLSNLYYSVALGFVGVKTSKGRRWCLN